MSMKTKFVAVLCALLLTSSFLTGCGTESSSAGSSPQEPVKQEENVQNNTETTAETQTPAPDKQEETKPAESETVEIYVPGWFYSNIKEDLQKFNPIQRPEDAYWVMTVPKDFPKEYGNRMLSQYNESLAAKPDSPIKSVSWDENFSELTINAEHPENITMDIAVTYSLLYNMFVINHEPGYKIKVIVKNNQDQSIYQTMDFPTNETDWIGAVIADGKIEIHITDACLRKNYEGLDCLTVSYLLSNHSDDNISFYVDVYDMAFQNGVQLDSTSSEAEHSEADPLKSLQPGYSMIVEKSYLLPNTNDDVTIEVKGVFDDKPIKASKTFILSEFPSYYIRNK